MIKKGEVPLGYKKTKIGIIPFDWKQDKLLNIALIVDGTHQTPQYMDKGVRFVSVENIGNIENSDKYISYEEYEKIKIKPIKNDILMTRITAGIIGDTQIVEFDEPMGYYVSLALIRCNEDMNVSFINQLIKSYYFRRELHKRIIHTAFPKKINLGDIGECQIILPNVSEQEKIVDMLNVIDIKVKKVQALIIEKKKQKNWIMQSLFTAKKRVKDSKCDWKKIKIKKFITELNEKTTENNQHEILSVTKDGIFKQSEHFNKQIASEDNCGYKVIRRNNLVFSTMNLWMGSLDVLKKYDVGIVSPAYKIFEFDKQYMIPEFGEYFMKSDYMIWTYGMNSEQGASVVRRNLDMDGLLNTLVRVPDIEEQMAISQILSQADKEIELLQKQSEQIKLEKKAMMQLLLTGIVRVNQKGGE